jgi:uncharacterized protein YjbJ (UPF0337 family)
MKSKKKMRIIMPLLGVVLLVAGLFLAAGSVMAADEPVTPPKASFIERVADVLGIEVSDLRDAFAQARQNTQDIEGESRAEAFKDELNEILHSEYGVPDDVTIQSAIEQVREELGEQVQARRTEIKGQLEGLRAEMQQRIQAHKAEMQQRIQAHKAAMQQQIQAHKEDMKSLIEAHRENMQEMARGQFGVAPGA